MERNEITIGKLYLSCDRRFMPDDCTWKEKMLSICIDLDHMDGSPSGLYMHLLGYVIQVYYPMKIGYSLVWSWGGQFFQSHWTNVRK